MSTWLPWLVVIGGPILSAIAGGTWIHFAERIHWHRLAQTWYDDGRDAGYDIARQRYGTMVPSVMPAQARPLEAAPPADGDQLAEAAEWDTITINLGAQFAAIKAGLYTP